MKSEATVAHEVLRATARTLANTPAVHLLVNMNPGVADYLYEAEPDEIERLERMYGTQIIPVAREGYHREHYEVVASNA